MQRLQRDRAKRVQRIVNRMNKHIKKTAWVVWMEMFQEENELRRKLGKILIHWQGKNVKTIFRSWKGNYRVPYLADGCTHLHAPHPS